MGCVQAGANVNVVDHNTWTPLYYATHGDTIEYLVAQGAQVNVQDRDGNTPLHIAIRRLRDEAMGALLRAGAKVQCPR